MKKEMRALAGLAVAGVMTLTSASTALADTAVPGGKYEFTIPSPTGEPETYQMEYSETPLYQEQQFSIENIGSVKADAAEDGYELKEVYIYIHGLTDTIWRNGWLFHGDNIRDTKTTEWHQQWGINAGVAEQADFTVDVNGQAYPLCTFYAGMSLLYSNPDTRMYAAVKLPKGYDGNCYLRLYDADSNGERYLDYFFSGNGEAVPATTSSAPSWKSDSKGWWVERPDGSCLRNEWYDDNGKWYYMGADGYMLTNTTTPDGYKVNAEGVWVQ